MKKVAKFWSLRVYGGGRSIGLFQSADRKMYAIRSVRPITPADFNPDGSTKNAGIRTLRQKRKLVTQVNYSQEGLEALYDILEEFTERTEKKKRRQS